MPRVDADELRRIGYELFEKAGCSPTDARTVVDHLVDSSLYGHDSHGQIRIYEYIRHIQDGIFDPKGQPHVETDRPCAATVNGGGALGQIGGAFATQLANRPPGTDRPRLLQRGKPRTPDHSLRRTRWQTQHQSHRLCRTSAQRRSHSRRYDDVRLCRGQNTRGIQQRRPLARWVYHRCRGQSIYRPAGLLR